MKELTKKQATREWVKEFNAINASLLERAFGGNNIDCWIERTPIISGDYVYYNGEDYKVSDVLYEKDSNGIDTSESKVALELDSPENEYVVAHNIEYIYYNDEAVEVEDTTDDYKFVITVDGEELKIAFKDVKEIDYEDRERLKVTSVTEDEFEVECTELVVPYNEVEKEFDGWLPMWSTLWTFNEGLDEYWAKENPELVAECGFRIFEDDETGDIYLGIDGAGYDFYEAHWIPLYEARGLQWHNAE